MTNKRTPKSISTQPTPEHKQSGGLFLVMILLQNSIHWLTSQFQLTKEEQEEAGIYLPGQRNK